MFRNVGREDILEISNSKEHPTKGYMTQEASIYQNSPEIQHRKKLKVSFDLS